MSLVVNAGAADAPAWRDCDVTVPTGSNAGVVLDQAVEDGCILEWSYSEYPGFGRYVTSIDHVTEAIATYWAFRVNDEYSRVGIDGYHAAGGDTVQFTDEEWLVPLA